MKQNSNNLIKDKRKFLKSAINIGRSYKNV